MCFLKKTLQSPSNILLVAVFQTLKPSRVSDVTGEMKTEQVKEGNLSKNDLDPNDAFLVSAGALGIWVWLGKSATKAERQGVMQMGAKFIKDNKLPPQTALTRTFQGMEPDEFKSLFMEALSDW